MNITDKKINLFYDRFQRMINENKLDVLSDIGITVSGRLVCVKGNHGELFQDVRENLANELGSYLNGSKLEPNAKLIEVSSQIQDRLVVVQRNQAEELILNQKEKQKEMGELIEGGFLYADLLLKKYPVTSHKILTLGRQNVLLNACLEQRLKTDYSDHVIPRPVAKLKEAVLACKDKDREWNQQQLNAIFDKIIPDKSSLEGKKLVIARSLGMVMTVYSITEPLRKYLNEKGIDCCFAFSVSDRVHRCCYKELDAIKGDDVECLVLPTKKQYQPEGGFFCLSCLDVVEPPAEDYLFQSSPDVWPFPENSQHSALINYVNSFNVEE